MTALEWFAVVMAVVLAVGVPILWSYEPELRGFTKDDEDEEAGDDDR